MAFLKTFLCILMVYLLSLIQNTLCFSQCPIGFVLFLKQNESLCVMLNNKVSYFMKNDICNGKSLEIGKVYEMKKLLNDASEENIWVRAIRAYERGPFINWNPESVHHGSPILYKNEWYKNNHINGDCLVFNLRMKKSLVVNCDEEFSSVCAIEKYRNSYENGNCDENFYLFNYPVQSCISKRYIFKDFRTRQQLEIFCENMGGQLVEKSVMYANNKFLLNSVDNDVFIPLKIKVKDENNNNSSEDKYISLSGTSLQVLPPDFKYNQVFCEQDPKNKYIDFQIKKTSDNELVVVLNEIHTSNNIINDIKCFTDAVTFHPQRVLLFKTNNKLNLGIKTLGDGYYWCNNMKALKEESEKILWIKNETALTDTYAVLLMSPNITLYYDDDLIEYINSTKTQFENVVRKKCEESKVILKRIFVNETILFHVYSPKHGCINKVKGMNIFSIRNLIKCNKLEIEDENIGLNWEVFETANSTFRFCYKYSICKTMTCISDFINGAYWKEELNYDSFSTETNVFSTDMLVAQTEQLPLKNILTNEDALYSSTNKLNEFFYKETDGKESRDILKDFDKTLNSIELSESKQIYIASENVDIAVCKINISNPITAIKINTKQRQQGIQFIENSETGIVQKSLTTSEAYLEMSSMLRLDHQSQISVVVFKNDSLFVKDSSQKEMRVNSHVIGLMMPVSESTDHYVDIHLRPYRAELKDTEEVFCAFWDYNVGEAGGWSTKGCEMIPYKKLPGFDTCRCNHLTYFAELIGIGANNISKTNKYILTTITYMGCLISLIGLLGICLTGIRFKTWRKEFSNKVWLNLSISLILLNVTFLLNVSFTRKTQYLCIIFGILLHYSVLSAFGWMVVTAVLSYKKLVKVFDSSSPHRLLKACLFGWFSPMCFIVPLLIIDKYNYVRKFRHDVSLNSFCYPSGVGFWVTVLLPITLVILFNGTIYTLVLLSLFNKPKVQAHESSKNNNKKVAVSFLLFFMFGLVWIFGILSEYILFNYLFCILGTFQGFIFFFFIIIHNKNTRRLWYDTSETSKNKYIINSNVSNKRSRSTENESSTNRENLRLYDFR